MMGCWQEQGSTSAFPSPLSHFWPLLQDGGIAVPLKMPLRLGAWSSAGKQAACHPLQASPGYIFLTCSDHWPLLPAQRHQDEASEPSASPALLPQPGSASC